MKAKLGVVMLLMGTSLCDRTHFSIGIGVGGYGYPYGYGYYAAPPPPPIVAYAPPYPGPGYTWIGRYWYPGGPRYYLHAGYWSRPPYYGGGWGAPPAHLRTYSPRDRRPASTRTAERSSP